MGQIKIYNNQDKQIKGYDFHYSYFLSIEPNFGTGFIDLQEQFSKRLKLDSITEFNYDPVSSLLIFNPPYKFLYNELPLPNRPSAQRDFWGYYNSNTADNLRPSGYEYLGDPVNDTTFFTSHFSFYQRPYGTYTGSEYFHSGADRNTDASLCQAGILNHIVFPTCGGIKYVYEPHEFFIQETNLFGGGLRIKRQILSHDNSFPNTNNIITEYDYCNSGRIMDLPQSYSLNRIDHLAKHSNWDSRNALSHGGYITYSHVKETISGSGHIEYIYLQPAIFGTVHEDFDSTTNEFIYKRPIVFDFQIYLGNYYDYYPKPYIPNYDWKRGLLSDKLVFNQSGDTIKTLKYKYQILRYKKIPILEAYHVQPDPGGSLQDCGFKVCRNYSISPWIELTSKREKTYDGNTVIEKTVNKEFASITHNQITSKTETNSDGKVFSERYKYIADIDFSQMTLNCKTTYLNCKADAKAERDLCLAGCEALPDPELRECSLNCYEQYETDTTNCLSAYNACLNGINLPEKTQVVFNMQRKHMISLPLETQKLVDNKTVGGKVFEYNTFIGTSGSIYKPKVEFSLLTENSIANCQQVHLDNQNNIVYDLRYVPLYNYDKYSTKGNPTEVFKENDIHTVYLWGYNDTYPVIKAENISFSVLNEAVNAATGSLMTLLNQIGDMTTEPQKAAWKSFNTDLRSYAGLSNALVTTYTYKPLVGVTSITDPNGIPAYFEYDAMGRLLIGRDNNSDIVKKYDYHYGLPAK